MRRERDGNFGIFEDSLPDGYGRYLLHKLLQKEDIDDFKLSALDRLSIVGSGGMGALTFEPETFIKQGTDVTDFDLLQEKAAFHAQARLLYLCHHHRRREGVRQGHPYRGWEEVRHNYGQRPMAQKSNKANTHNVFFNSKAALEAKVDEAFAKWAMPNEQLKTLCSFKRK